ncbi:hypothetical protein CALCODRAFT_513762 [Calocera cornea HHB12733]|uniref:DNA replication regulator Sld3 C-terminal domain-containing protein n=1 Tax=Calocera cornea HHB12733 TaxID=1353952 RepID=A0A165K9J4_9BASI|nr:hypothetical protein CALCODRAFT_513762 [Calocera cornea HHB12733]
MAASPLPLPMLDLACPLAWPSHAVSDYPLRQAQAETPAQSVKRVYLETLWLPEELIPLSSIVPALRHLPAPALARAFPGVLLSLDAIEQKFRRDLPALLRDQGADGAEAVDGGAGARPGEGDTEVALMRFVWRLRCRQRGQGDHMQTAESGEGGDDESEEKEEREMAEWLDELERREVQIQALLRLLLVTLPPSPPTPSPKKRKRHAAPSPPSHEEEFDSLTDRLCIWHALGAVVQEVRLPGSEEDRGWVKVFQEDVLAPMFEHTLAGPLVQAFHEKLDPTLSPPSSPEPSPPGLPTLPFAGLPALSTSLETATAIGSASSRSASVSSLTFGNPGYRRSMSVSSAGGQSQSGRSVSVSATRTGVNNSRNWAGKEVRMGRRAIGGAKPQQRQASLPAAPPPQQPPRALKRTESQMLVMSTPVKKPSLPNRPPPSSADEIMETPQKGG